MTRSQKFIQKKISATTDEETGLQHRFIVFWLLFPVEDAYDAMGVVLMGGEV